jgi:DNA (cytosine-5)-methyltransferase 1
VSGPKIGSLFSGVGGLDLGVQQVIGGDVVWHVEFDAAPSKVLAHHWPDVPNYGDITKVDWANVEPIDILTGGFPCQDVSLAGARAGMNDTTRSGLWAHYAHAISVLKPKLVVIENVRGLLSAEAVGAMESDPWGVGDGNPRSVINAFGAVLGDLAGLGYDVEWCGVRAADAGAPHGRYRVFIVAEDTDSATSGQRWLTTPGQTESGRTRANTGRRSGTPTADASGDEPERWGGHHELAGTPGTCQGGEEERERVWDAVSDSGSAATDWGLYEPAIRRWEQVLGQISPTPTNPDGRDGSHRLAAEFVEWMMGLPAGHVTDPSIGLTRNQQLKALGNGVVPAQCALALRMLGVRSWQ